MVFLYVSRQITGNIWSNIPSRVYIDPKDMPINLSYNYFFLSFYFLSFHFLSFVYSKWSLTESLMVIQGFHQGPSLNGSGKTTLKPTNEKAQSAVHGRCYGLNEYYEIFSVSIQSETYFRNVPLCMYGLVLQPIPRHEQSFPYTWSRISSNYSNHNTL